MLKFFRNIRYKFIEEGRFINYLKYAIGEIFLVVIGILIAVSINNWNENRKQQQLFLTILKNIEDDMKSDTLVFYQTKDNFRKGDSIFKRILDNKMTREDYINCERCANIINAHAPLNFKSKGFEMLKGYVDNQNETKDSLASDILMFYSQVTDLSQIINEHIKNDVSGNLKYSKENHAWFYLNHEQRIKNEDFLNYVVNSTDFKNRVAMQRILVVKNLKSILDTFNKNAKILLPRIEARLN
ncbi:DUF6090 family protein [Flavobacterium sp.]|uniref:DUF6090 family protein n=1 Tax=Flavobacterium sp. TaxID=239 RepID=UPI0025C450E3|nr:DUF6090 family protein [Flavobacterium sp.]MBA4154542.1 hypothetical protein [Flavobacterium sp.]